MGNKFCGCFQACLNMYNVYFKMMNQQYLSKELGWKYDLWAWFMKNMVVAVMLGKSIFVLVSFLLLKLIWDPFSYNLFTKYLTNEEDQQNRNFFHLSFEISIPPLHYDIMGWFMLWKAFFSEREEGVTEKRRKKKRSLVLVSST